MNRRRTFGFLLKDVSRLSAKNFERHAQAASLGLTLEQCRVLAYLQGNEGINQVRLAELTDTDPMTLVRILDHMQAKGWLERRRDPADRRVWRLHLTGAAQPILRRVFRIGDRARAEALSGLGEAQVNALLDALQHVHANLAALVPGAIEPDRIALAHVRERKPVPVAGSGAAARSRRVSR